jgi:hypothetical protein
MDDARVMAENTWNGVERRVNPDRRANNRQGKYDRRRNRCGRCVFFNPAEPPEMGFCRQHQQAMARDAFACWLFEEVTVSF